MTEGVQGHKELVVVVGSVNADFVLRVARRPDPGETVGDGVLEIHPGGKGGNQALAAARSGAAVELVARVGDDSTGGMRIAELKAGGVGTDYVRVSPGLMTGVAFITLTPDAQNSITVAPGANSKLMPSDIDTAAKLLMEAAVLVVQLEIPIGTVARAVELAGPATTVVLNYSPSRDLTTALLARVDVLVANEGEAAALSGCPASRPADALLAARRILVMGPSAVVITLGPLGAIAVDAHLDLEVPAPRVAVVDTTGAGDAFVGALAARLAGHVELGEAVAFGVAVGSATTEERGALPRMPAQLLERQ